MNIKLLTPKILRNDIVSNQKGLNVNNASYPNLKQLANDEVSFSGKFDAVSELAEGAKNVVKKAKTKKPCLGDVWLAHNQALSDEFKDDVAAAVLDVPGATFIPEFNVNSVKGIQRMLDKLLKRNEEFEARGFKGTIRDYVRATAFMPDADKNYMDLVDAMKNLGKKTKKGGKRRKGYEIADTYVEDANGQLVKDAAGKPVMKKDIDVRFGDNATPSGYEDVQIRFAKGDDIYELLILPGPNYASFKNHEHTHVYEKFAEYDKFLKNDVGAKQIVKGIKKEFYTLTKRLYAAAKERDISGIAANTAPITFTKENIKTIDDLFKSLKNLYRGKFNALPPSKRKDREFKNTQIAMNLDSVEKELRKVMEMYKPID